MRLPVPGPAVIMDESLSLDKHWQARIDKARAMLGKLNVLEPPNGVSVPPAGAQSIRG